MNEDKIYIKPPSSEGVRFSETPKRPTGAANTSKNFKQILDKDDEDRGTLGKVTEKKDPIEEEDEAHTNTLASAKTKTPVQHKESRSDNDDLFSLFGNQKGKTAQKQPAPQADKDLSEDVALQENEGEANQLIAQTDVQTPKTPLARQRQQQSLQETTFAQSAPVAPQEKPKTLSALKEPKPVQKEKSTVGQSDSNRMSAQGVQKENVQWEGDEESSSFAYQSPMQETEENQGAFATLGKESKDISQIADRGELIAANESLPTNKGETVTTKGLTEADESEWDQTVTVADKSQTNPPALGTNLSKPISSNKDIGRVPGDLASQGAQGIVQPKKEVSSPEGQLITKEDFTEKPPPISTSEVPQPIAKTKEPKEASGIFASQQATPRSAEMAASQEGVESVKGWTKKENVANPFPQEHVDLSSVNPQGVITPVAPVEITSNAATTAQRPIPASATMHVLLDALVKEITTMRLNDKTETTIVLQRPPLFANAQVMLTSFDSARGDLNITFANLTQNAQHVIEQQQQNLMLALETKGYNVHIFTATTVELQSPIASAQPSEQGGQQRQGQGRGDQQQKNKEEREA